MINLIIMVVITKLREVMKFSKRLSKCKNAMFIIVKLINILLCS